jgi:hypothetical protein
MDQGDALLDCLRPGRPAFELAGLLRWLGEKGDREGSRFLANLFGYPVPTQALLEPEGLSSEAVRVEMVSLNRAAGERGVSGIEAMVLPGVVKMTKPLLLERLRIAASLRVPIALSWYLAHLPSGWLPEVQEALSAGWRSRCGFHGAKRPSTKCPSNLPTQTTGR